MNLPLKSILGLIASRQNPAPVPETSTRNLQSLEPTFQDVNTVPMQSRSAELRDIFSIEPHHCLELQSARERIAPGGQRMSAMYNETDESMAIVALYRIWINQSAHPPYRLTRGWEKYTPKGELQDRETRYSRGEPMSTSLPATVQLDDYSLTETDQVTIAAD